VDVARGLATLQEPMGTGVKFEFPILPMLGSIGVAAPLDTAPTSQISGLHGGNIDYNRIGDGATLILPVFHPGGLLFMGDGHALQGDGEPTGTGIEISLDVEFSVSVRKQARLAGPRVETDEFLISIGSQPEFASDLNRALQMATSDMVGWLVDSYGLSPMAAHLFIGYTARYDVVTVAGSMALRIPRRLLASSGGAARTPRKP
jgi:acetamidase/formamidase